MRAATPDILGVVMAGPVAAATPLFANVDLTAIVNDGGTQMRAGINWETVKEYADAMRDGATFPPIILYHDGDSYWLADGFHRFAAWKQVHTMPGAPGKYDESHIRADVRAGTRRDAILHAAGANANHGLRRTNEDKRRSVEVLLRDPEWSQWSNRMIATACAVDEGTVRNWRGKIPPTAEIPQSTERKGADGRTIDTANIGTKQRKLFIGDLKGIVVTWHANEWRRDWPENPSHTNGAFWREITAWMHANITDAWQEGDLKEAIKAVHASATRQPRTEPPASYTVPEAVGDKPLPEWAVDEQEINESKRAPGQIIKADRTGVLSRSAQDAGYTAWATYRDGEIYGAGVTAPGGAASTGGKFDSWKRLAEWTNDHMRQHQPPAQPQPAPHFDPSDDRTWELRRLETRIELIVRQLKDQEKEYGRLTGDFTTALEARRGMERMVATLRRNQGLDE